MKLKNKIICLILCVIVIITTTICAFAFNREKEDSVETKSTYDILVEKGYPESYLDGMNEKLLEKLLEFTGDGVVRSVVQNIDGVEHRWEGYTDDIK